jgi:hypothetical protein
MKDTHEDGRIAALYKSSDSLTERRLSHALEAVPQIEVGDDFARRVMSRTPERRRLDRVLRAEPTSVGRGVALGALLILAAVMVAMVPLARGTGYLASMAVECLLCLEFVGITLWMSLELQRRR